MSEEEVLRTEHVSKSFGRVTALRDASIRLAKSEVLGLLGDNGAGKSTLLKILTGFHRPTSGKIYFESKEIHLKSVRHARSLGIEPVYQDLALINELSVYRNMFLQREIMYGGPFRILNDRAKVGHIVAPLGREGNRRLAALDRPLQTNLRRMNAVRLGDAEDDRVFRGRSIFRRAVPFGTAR